MWLRFWRDMMIYSPFCIIYIGDQDRPIGLTRKPRTTRRKGGMRGQGWFQINRNHGDCHATPLQDTPWWPCPGTVSNLSLARRCETTRGVVDIFHSPTNINLYIALHLYLCMTIKSNLIKSGFWWLCYQTIIIWYRIWHTGWRQTSYQWL